MASDRRVARVVPDVAGIEAEFDYLIPEPLDGVVRTGSIVRVQLQGRRVRGWVVDADATPPEGVRLREIQKFSGVGPSRELIDLAGWAAWRWAGKRSFFLQTASPPRMVSSVDEQEPGETGRPAEYFDDPLAVLRWPPAADPLPVALAAVSAGPSLIITPTQRGAERLARRLREQGANIALHPEQWTAAAAGAASVVGTRAAAWAPMPRMAAVLVLDAHDEALQSERSPTWSAVDVAVERARRRGVPCLLVSATPRAEHLSLAPLHTVDRAVERDGWAATHVVDLRRTDPRTGLYSPVLVDALRSDKRVVCVLNRKGRASTLVCTGCDELARCERCAGALAIRESDLECRRCKQGQPVVCRHCGATRFKQLRPGVSKVREELESLAQRAVGEVTGESDELPPASVLIGTEAVLHRVGRAGVVAFIDFDQELLAPRVRASEDALVLLGRASRIVGGRRSDGVVIVQTRQPGHEVIDAAVHGDPSRFVEVDKSRREQMGWPPYAALAVASGPGARAFVSALPKSIDALDQDDDRWILRAADTTVLADALAAAARPSGRLRVEVDPARV